MDKLTSYQQIVASYLQECKEYVGGGKTSIWQTIIDSEQKHFLLLSSGWQNGRYIHALALHIDLVGEKIWIQRNNTEWLIASELVEKGVSPSDIVLGFISPESRSKTKYAIN